MTESPTTTLPQAGAGGPGELLATKLYLPRPQPGFVARPRLLERLEEGLARGLVLVCAPAGFGKTALLADWARAARRPVAWMSLDQGDNDPARFWRHLVAAVGQARPGIADQVVGLLGPPAPPSFERLVTALINRLAAESAQVLLVLDDYHLVDAQPVHASLEFLLEHRPPGLQLVLASRADPPLPLARLRARGQLAELRAAELRFTAEEAAELLGEALGSDPPLPDAVVAALAARTEGWAAGLQLAALSLREHTDAAGFVATFSGSHRYVLDYLTEEVLARQPEHITSFLLETSVLDRLSGDLCDALTGRTDSQQVLEEIERANLFLLPLDAVRGWWRYHHLFADLLRARLQQQRPEGVPQLHRNAAGWCERHGLADDAIHHALAAGETTWAARLIEQHVEALYRRSEAVTLRRWLSALPSEVIRSRPRLCVALAANATIAGRLEEAESLLADAERALAAGGDEPFEPSVGRHLSSLVNLRATVADLHADLARQRGDLERAAAFAKRSLASLSEDDQALHAVVRWQLAMVDWMRGRPDQAEPVLTEIVTNPFLQSPRPWYDLGRVQQVQGRLGTALQAFGRAVEAASEGGHPLPLAGIGHVGLADVLRERAELDAALEHATEAVALCRQLPYAQWLVAALTTLARVRQTAGDQAGAIAAMEEAAQTAPNPDIATDMLSAVGVQRARLALVQGRVADAARWVEQRGLRANDEPSYQREQEHLVLARVLLARELPDRALGLLERLHTLAVAQQRTGSLIEIQALQALALVGDGDEPGGVAALIQALKLAYPEGYVRVFADEGAPMAALLGRLIAAQRTDQAATHSIPLEYLGRLMRAFPQARPPGRLSGAVVPGLVEQLSDRESEVLALLAAGRSNQQIAEELVVALNTVKKHVTHILDKLGAANRTEAVTRARELGLLG